MRPAHRAFLRGRTPEGKYIPPLRTQAELTLTVKEKIK